MLVQKIVVVWQLKGCPSLFPTGDLDSGAYAELAQQVLSGNIFLGPRLYFVSPLYIYFLAASLALTKSYTAVRLAQVVLGTAAIGAIWLMTREWFGRRAAWFAAALAAFCGLFTFYEALLFQASLDTFLTSAGLLCLTLGLRRHRSAYFAASGLIFGAQILNRPNILISTIAIVAACMLLRRWRDGLTLAAGVALAVSPVVIRNVVISHELALASSQGGINFYIGNGEGATGFYRTVPGVTASIKGQREDAQRVATQALGRSATNPVSDKEASEYFTNLTLDYMAAHPGIAVALFVRKLGWVFHAAHVPLPYSYPFFRYDWPTWLRFQFVGPWLLIPLGIVGLVFAAPREHRRARDEYVIFAIFVPAYAASVAAFLVAERYRLPLLVPLAVGSGAALDAVWTALRAARPAGRPGRPGRMAPRMSAKTAAAVGLFAAIAVAANWRTHLNDGRWDEGLRLADQYVLLGRYDEAETWTTKLEATARRPGMAHQGIGLQYMESGQPARAIGHLQKSLELGMPLPAEKSLEIGRLAASRLAAPASAEPFFAHAVRLDGDNAAARLQHGVNLIALGRIDAAAVELAEAARLDPRNASSFAQLAYAEVRLNRVHDARAHVRTALALDPSEPMARQLAAFLGR